MIDFTKETDETLVGWYQLHHGSDSLSRGIHCELIKRGFTIRLSPFAQVGGRMGYEPIVTKGGKKYL